MKKLFSDKRRSISILVVACLVGLVGLALQLLTNAASPSASIEPEGSVLSEGVKVVTDATASGGKAIVFDAPLPTPEVTLVNTNFDALPVSAPMSLANFRLAMNDPVVNGSLAETSIRSETGRGNYFRITLPADRYGVGVTSTPILKQAVDEATITYDLRFAGAFEFGKGGKLPGLGGYVPGTTASASACVPPSSETWSGRAMWNANGSWVGYIYSVYKTDNCGQSYNTNANFVANKWHTVKQRYKMNTIAADGTPNADGIHEMWLDGVPVLNKTSFKFRDNNKLHITHMFWSIFRGGSDSTWQVGTPGPIDIDNLVVKSPS